MSSLLEARTSSLASTSDDSNPAITTLTALPASNSGTSLPTTNPPISNHTSSFPKTHKTFPLFPRFPAEIRLKIFAFACAVPRTVDIWTDFKRCEVDNSIFYCQRYLVLLAPLPPPHILAASKESREEALKHYSLEFRTQTNPGAGLAATMPAKWYVSWEHDILMPMAYWNLVSFSDFMQRCIKNGVKRVALDVNGVFWKDNLRCYILVKDAWAFNGVREVILYDAKEDDNCKGGEYLDKFRRRHGNTRRVISFEPVENPSEELVGVQKLLNRCFDRIQGVPTGAETEVVLSRSYVEDFSRTEKKVLVRPEVKMMKLVFTRSEAVVID